MLCEIWEMAKINSGDGQYSRFPSIGSLDFGGPGADNT
jgi:hypothetical protein